MQLAHAAAFLCELKRRGLEKPDDEGARTGEALTGVLLRKKEGHGSK